MADYYAVLKRTLSGFGEPSQSLRAKIYEKARTTIARQLDATQPPLPDETKAAQLQQLDEAIARIEAEYAPPGDDFIGDPPPLPVATAAAPERVDAAPAPEPVVEEPSPEPSEPPEAAVADAVPADEPPRFDPTPEAAPEPVSFMEPTPAVEATPSVPVESGPADPIADAFATIEAARAREEVAADDGSIFDPAAFDAAARTEADRAAGAAAPVVAPTIDAGAGVATSADGDIFDDPEVGERDAAALAPAPVAVRPLRKKSGRGVLWFLLIVAAVGLLFVFRGPLLAAVGVERGAIDRFVASIPGIGPVLVGEVDDPNDPTRPKPVPTIRITPEPEAPVVDDGKREERLGADGQEVEPQLPAPTIPSAEPDLPVQQAPEPEAPAPEPELVPITPVAPAPADTVPDDTTQAPAAEPPATAVDETPAASAETGAGVAVAQSAILYEEGGATGETRSDRGAVLWSLVEQSPGNGEPAEPAIRAVLDVPERSLKATITLRRNTDLALAASHLMEVNFEPATGFSGQNIDELLSVRMKPSEAGQGSPLAIVPAKIAPGYFYVALDNLPSARERNVELMRTAKWIDIPVEYVTGRRALVSLEKGVVGERVFAQALAAWDAAAQ